MTVARGPDGMYAGWIETARGPLFACHHPAEGESQRDVAVLLCDPIGSDRMNLHLAYRALALALAASGFPVLRVDYYGTGDSAGSARDAGQVGAWLQSLHDAADWLLRSSGRSKLGCFGALLGGTLATTFAASRSDVRSLALWGASVSGSAFLREVRAFQAMRSRSDAAPLPRDWQDGDQEASGFLLTRETVDAIAALEIDASACRSVRQAAVFARGRNTSEAAIVASFERAGIPVTPPPAAIVDIAHLEDERVYPPELLIEQLAAWWRAAHPANTGAMRGADRPELADRIVLRDRDGQEVEEQWVRFGADAGLVGIVSRPTAKASGPGIVLVNGGVNHRPGINRNYTDWAREWAARGATVIRMDIRGLGDSVPERLEDVARLYRAKTRADVEAAVALLTTRYGVDEVACGGLCAGGFQAFAAALGDAKITALFLLNPLRLDPGHVARPGARPEFEYESLGHYARSLLRPSRWSRAWSRDEKLIPMARSVAARLVRQARGRVQRTVAELRGEAPPPATQLAERFLALGARGCRVLLVFDAAEPMRHRFAEALAHDRDRLEAIGCFQERLVEHADHIFLPLASQQEVGALLGSWLFDDTRSSS